MVEILVMVGLAVATGVGYLLKGKKGASEIDFLQNVLRMLANAYTTQGEDKAVEYVLWRLDKNVVQKLGKMLGVSSVATSDYRYRIIRTWLEKQLYMLAKKAKEKMPK